MIDLAYSEPLSTWMAPLAPESLTKTPRSRDGRCRQFKLNVHNGFLGSVRELREEGVLAVSFDSPDSGVEVTVEAPDRFAAPLLLVLTTT